MSIFNVHAKTGFRTLFAFLLLLPVTALQAQQASAEYISEIEPMRIVSGEQVQDGIVNVFFNDDKLYITNVWSGLQVVDVSDLQNPVELGTFFTEDRSHNCFVENDRAYLSSELYGVTILDVSDPANIKEIGRINTEGDALWVVASEPYVYVAEETRGVHIYDVSNPAKPIEVGRYDTADWAWGLYLVDKTLYVADKSNGLQILDVTSAAKPERIGQFPGMRYAKVVQVDNDIAYVANGADGLWIIDVSNKALPKKLSSITVDGYVFHVFKTGNTAFLANETERRLDIIDVTNPSNPVKEGDYQAESKVFSSWKNDVYVFVAADNKTIIVRHNHPPVITKLDNMTVDENTPLIFSAQAYDPDGDAYYFEIENLPEGAVFDSLSGAFNWTPTYDQSGSYPAVKISVIERTGSALSTSTTFDITVNHVNRNPVLPDVADAGGPENSAISFTLEEGSDPDVEDKGRLTYSAQNMPMGATFNPETRTFSWTPTFEQSGVYTVDFLIHDPAGGVYRDGATITVDHVDRKPVLEPLADATINEAEQLQLTLSGQDPDQEDQDKLSYRAENLPEGATFDAQTATFSWTPTYDQSGTYEDILFIFQAGALSDSSTLTVTVNHVNRPPVLDAIANQQTDENAPLSFTISGSDPDVEDAGKLVYTAQNLPQGATFDQDSLVFNWTPGFDQSGTYDNVGFTVSDPAGLQSSQTLTITVDHVNRTPALAAIAAQSVDENSLLTIELQGSDPDIEDQGNLQYSIDALPDGAQLQGSTFTWTPGFTQSGEYPVVFSVTDDEFIVTQGTTITVNHVNRPPVLDSLVAQSVDENQPLQFSVSASDPDEEDAGQWQLSVRDLPEGAVFDAATGGFTWTPKFEQSGSYTPVFVVADPVGATDELTVPITVNHVNRTPQFEALQAQTVDENSQLTVSIPPATDPDAEDQGQLTYTATNLPQGAVFDEASLQLTWTPGYDQSGNYTTTIVVSDGEFQVEQPLEITVNHVNRAPLISAVQNQVVDENTPWQVALDESDLDAEDQGVITVTVENLPEGATFDEGSRTISWTPGYNDSGVYPGITATVTDPAGLSASISFDLTVNHVNRPPQIDDPGAQTVGETETLTFAVTASDPDQEDEGKLTFSAAGLPQGAEFTADGSFSWTPGYDQSGEYNINISVSDGTIESTLQVPVTVNNLNREPSITGPPRGTVQVGQTLSLNFRSEDPDNDDLSYELTGAPDGMTISGGTLSWTPQAGQEGSYTVSVIVSDGEATAEAAVTIEAKPAPVPVPADTSQSE